MPSSASSTRHATRVPASKGPDPQTAGTDTVVPLDFSRYLVSDLLAHPGAHRDEHLEVPVSMSSESVTVEDTAEGDVRIEAAAGAVVVRGDVAVDAAIVCSRCLQPATSTVEADLVVTYGDADDEDSRPISGDGRIDLATAVHEELAMAMPHAPLCKEDCLGLCTDCGTDLNTNPCGGHPDVPDSPFAALEGLFPEQ